MDTSNTATSSTLCTATSSALYVSILLVHTHVGSSQHHTAEHSGPLQVLSDSQSIACRSQDAGHSMHNMGTINIAASSALCSIGETYRHWYITASHCCSRLATTSSPTALQEARQSTACKSQHAADEDNAAMQHH